VTAGASAPEELVDAVIARLAPTNGVEEVRFTEEDEYFPPPRNLRDLQTAIETAITAMSGGSLSQRPQVDDRALAASAVLASL
jgi:4-hydroxy-3-methylbut-2-enyl diphosphate reductase